ncbi:cysteine desulfurase family protein [Microbacterium hydrocarbonoxydans]|uniref:cysteine desulfurase family protein n=1 Tax=Microbacterium hydrocarbonoxydans TaxID=273678 RepID=UPI00203FF9B5|nr:cysteine desulfurase family protein [Microbacterium hydrocarbonoxydans]MCM3779400.1 cysteine desulfurase [Microbacterium hydrocarbonoxydans]
MLYLDHAATSPLRPEVRDAMLPYLTGAFGNPSSHHTVGEAAAQALEAARSRVATVLGFRSGDVIFTGGGTEANNLAVKGIVLAALARGRRHLVVSSIEHESILAPADYLRRFHDVEVTHLPVDRAGRIEAGDLRAALRDDTALVSVDHANNEIGTVQDVAAISALTSVAGVPLHVDAVQSAGWLPLRGVGADAVTIAGHKIGAPQGIGVLAVRGRVPVEPLLHGGGQERGRRSGTENVAGAIALATALELAASEQREVHARVGEATARFIAGVLSAVPEASLTGDPHSRLPGCASFTFAGINGETVLLELERRGVVSSSGSACAADSGEPSHVLLACGLDPDLAQTAVRFTFGREPLSADVPDRLAAAVAEAVGAAAGN